MDAAQRRAMAAAVAGDDPLAGMSPIDLMKLRQELEARKVVTPEQRAANLKQTGWDVLSVIPGPGNAISAKDAWDSGNEAASAFGEGDWRRGALASAMAGLSGAGAVMGLPFGRMAGDVAKDAGRTTRIFAGPMAKTADHAALGKAQEMVGAGASREDVWRDTGWFQGADGKWRFEIDDSAADIAGERSFRDFLGYQTGRPGSQATRFNAVDHPQLREAYDTMPKVDGIYAAGIAPRGLYDGGTDSLRAKGSRRDDAFSVLLHELQHGVQSREGFARGGSPDEMADVVRQAQAPMSGYEAYRRLAGEVEARNVEARRNMTAAERRATPPWLTQDTPNQEQLVVRRHLGAGPR